MGKINEVTEKILEPILAKMKLELVDIEFIKEGKNWFLRVYIDSENGVDIEECAKVSEELSETLDKLDPIDHPYFLEVSSPGAERPLKTKEDIANAVGKHVHVKTYEPIDGEKIFEGELLQYENETLQLAIKVKTKIKKIDIPYEKVAKARLAVSF